MELGELAKLWLNLREEFLDVFVFAWDIAEELHDQLGNAIFPLNCVEKIFWDVFVALGLSNLRIIREILFKNGVLE